jgi:hypothetical protein
MSPARLNKMPVRIILDIVLQPPLDWLGRGLVMVPVSSQLEIVARTAHRGELLKLVRTQKRCPAIKCLTGRRYWSVQAVVETPLRQKRSK